MTTPGNLICSKCGFSNVPGDQFCGSCGSFLEWEGVTAPTDPATTAPGSDVPVVGPRTGPTTPPPPTDATATAAPPPVTATPPTAAAGALVRCPACGIANPAGRTFCQSCGT